MAKNPITKEEVLNKFLVTSMYRKPVGWPRETETVAACKIICTDGDGNQLSEFCPVYRNEPDKHVEVKLMEYLETLPKYCTRKIIVKVKVYSNYSPCSKCVEKMLGYLNAGIEMTITFANFYTLTHEYAEISHYDMREDKNIRGLIGFYKLGHPAEVELRLFGVHVGWERFLGMSEFFNLSEDEKNECLDKAESPRRKDRERQDQKVWDYVFRD